MELEPLDRAHREEATASVRGVFGFQRAVTLPDLWLPVFLAVALCRPNEAPAETGVEKPPGSGGLSGQFVIRPADPLASSRQAINLAFTRSQPEVFRGNSSFTTSDLPIRMRHRLI